MSLRFFQIKFKIHTNLLYDKYKLRLIVSYQISKNFNITKFFRIFIQLKAKYLGITQFKFIIWGDGVQFKEIFISKHCYFYRGGINRFGLSISLVDWSSFALIQCYFKPYLICIWSCPYPYSCRPVLSSLICFDLYLMQHYLSHFTLNFMFLPCLYHFLEYLFT